MIYVFELGSEIYAFRPILQQTKQQNAVLEIRASSFSWILSEFERNLMTQKRSGIITKEKCVREDERWGEFRDKDTNPQDFQLTNLE
jgi:hypothetical protein